MKRNLKYRSSFREKPKEKAVSKEFEPEDPTLSKYYSSIVKFILNLNQNDGNGAQIQTFYNSFKEIMMDLCKTIKRDSGWISITIINSRWQILLNDILFHVHKLNQTAKEQQIHDSFSAIRAAVVKIHSAPPDFQLTKKDHHSLYIQIKKALSLIYHSVEIKDNNQALQQIKKFRNDLNHSYSKFFTTAKLDSKEEASLLKSCKSNIKNIDDLLSGKKINISIPTELHQLSIYLSTAKSENKGLAETTRRSKTPPARIPFRAAFQKNDPKLTKIPPNPKLNVSSARVGKLNSSSSTSRSKTPPSMHFSKTNANRNLKTTSSNSSVTSQNHRSLTKAFSPKTTKNSTALSSKKSHLHSSSNPSTPRKNQTKTNSPDKTSMSKSPSNAKTYPRNNPAKSIFSKTAPKKLNLSSSLVATSSSKNKNKQTETPKESLLSSVTSIGNISRQQTNSKSSLPKDNLNASGPILRNFSIQSFDSATDQLVQAVNKAKEEFREASPTLDRLQRDLSGEVLYMQNDHILNGKFINKLFDSFSERLNQFELFAEINENIKDLFSKLAHHKVNDEEIDQQLSIIDEMIVSSQQFSGDQRKLFNLGRSMRDLNHMITCSMSSNKNNTIQDPSELSFLMDNIENQFSHLRSSTNEKIQSKIDTFCQTLQSSKRIFTKHFENIKEIQDFNNKNNFLKKNLLLLEERQVESINFDFDFEEMTSDDITSLYNSLSTRLSSLDEELQKDLDTSLNMSVFSSGEESQLSLNNDNFQNLSNINNQMIEIQSILSNIDSNEIKDVSYQGRLTSRPELEDLILKLIDQEQQILETFS